MHSWIHYLIEFTFDGVEGVAEGTTSLVRTTIAARFFLQ
jgi:hypothetical protein